MRFLSLRSRAARRRAFAAAFVFVTSGGALACSALTSFDGLVGAQSLGAIDGSDEVAAKSVYDASNSMYAQTVLGDSPIAYFRLDETTGTVAHDLSSSNLRATYGSLVRVGQPGLLTGDNDFAAVFSGQNDAGPPGILTMSRATVLEPVSELSVEAWINFTDDLPNEEIVSYGNTAGAPFQPWVLQLHDGALEFYTAAITQTFDGQTAMASQTTYHVVATYGPSAISLYVNGALDKSYAGGPTITSDLYDHPEGLAIGGGGTDDFPLRGTIDEVAIYNYALTASQIKAHFSAGSK